MRQSGSHLKRLCWSLTLGLIIMLMSTGKAGAQYLGYGWGGAYPGMGFGYPGVGFGYPGMGYGYAGAGYAYPGWGYGYPGIGYGYPAFGYGLAYPGPVYVAGYPSPYNWGGYWNPLFGVGLTPLGVQSFSYETRVLGRVPRSSASYYGAVSRRY